MILEKITKFLSRKPRKSLSHQLHPPHQDVAQEIANHLITPEMQQANQRLFLSFSSLGLATVGTLFSPLFTVASIPIMLYLNVPFARQAYTEIVKERRIGFSLIDGTIGLINLALGLFWLEALFLCLFSGYNRILLQTKDTSRDNLVGIFGLQPDRVHVLMEHEDQATEVEIKFEQLEIGNQVVVYAGEVIPVDGRIVSGYASINQQHLTGESNPAELAPGDQVFASTILLAGKIVVEVETTGKETVALQIAEILQQTADHKTALQTRGEQIADASVLPILALSSVTLFTMGPFSAVAILFSCFGYVMRFVSPVSVLNFLDIASQEGILVKDGRALETLSQVDTVVFDKTGTLTLEQPHVAKILCIESQIDEDGLLQLAATAEYRQTHPIARAICQAAQARGMTLEPAEDAAYEIGYGIKAVIHNQTVLVGSRRFMALSNIELTAAALMAQKAANQHGYTLVFVAVDEQIYGAIELHPTLRPGARETVAALQKQGLDLYILSGDHEEPTRQLADSLGISNYFAQVLPEAKSETIAALQAQGRTVCFVGDGINDAIALKQANVSVSLLGASTVAKDIAQVVMMNQDLDQLLALFSISHHLDKNMNQNFVISVIPSAFSVLGVYLLGFQIVQAGLLVNATLATGLLNAMQPMQKYKNRKMDLQKLGKLRMKEIQDG